ncbi:MAG: PhnD/SsuA/transferrin family substrate-binding protein [Methylovulum sp.]|nr:PhnD/SsuA/transferrin family substrate-binding protein [Methylovulum sp.]
MNNVKLRIDPKPSSEKPSQQFAFIGTIDVDAVDVLEALYILPPNCAVEINFAQVERVNSMGLAQLLKLFELWQKHNNSIYITNVNRMIGILFKMTGLTRFLSEAPAAPAVEPPASTSVQQQTASTNHGTEVTSASLCIRPKPLAESLSQQFAFIGAVDVEAIPALEALYSLPPMCQVELDFAQLLRVNSMGLAQLLKLFEHWQKQEITIRIFNTNRMIGVLFKMTGLTRFLADGQAASVPTKKTVEPQRSPATPVAERKNAPPAQTLIPPHVLSDDQITPTRRASATVTDKAEKLKLWVSAQSSQQMNGWYFFNTYLQRHLDREVHLELSHGAMTERRITPDQMDIVFTKPFEATRLLLQHNFQPILRPIDQTDEVTLLVRAEDPRQNLADFQGGKVVTAAQDNFVYLLGRFLLEQDESALEDMEYVFSGHDIKALQMLLKGNADILFMLSETYQGLSGLTRKMLRQIDQSETAFAFHLVSVSPSCAELGGQLAEVLLDMNKDSQGRQVLADLGMEGWIKPTPDEIDMLVMLFKRYADAN